MEHSNFSFRTKASIRPFGLGVLVNSLYGFSSIFHKQIPSFRRDQWVLEHPILYTWVRSSLCVSPISLHKKHLVSATLPFFWRTSWVRHALFTTSQVKKFTLVGAMLFYTFLLETLSTPQLLRWLLKLRFHPWLDQHLDKVTSRLLHSPTRSR